MKPRFKVIAVALLSLLPWAFSYAAPLDQVPPAGTKQGFLEPQELTWDQLMPEPDQKVVDAFNQGKMNRRQVIKYLSKLGQTPMSKMDNVYGRMPGYLVPLNMDKNQKATELLLVPTMGACVHVPPPPPNQTIYIKYDKGISVTEAGYTPYWVIGTLRLEKNDSDYTETLYAMHVEKIEEYK